MGVARHLPGYFSYPERIAQGRPCSERTFEQYREAWGWRSQELCADALDEMEFNAIDAALKEAAVDEVNAAIALIQAAVRGCIVRAVLRSAAPPSSCIVRLAPLYRAVFAVVVIDRRTRAEYKGGLEPGCEVRLNSLQGRADLNGTVGTIHEWLADAGRWAVRCDAGGGLVRAKEVNLINLGRPPEEAPKKAKGAKQRHAQKAQVAKTGKQNPRKARNYEVCWDGTVLDYGPATSAPNRRLLRIMQQVNEYTARLTARGLLQDTADRQQGEADTLDPLNASDPPHEGPPEQDCGGAIVHSTRGAGPRAA